MVGGQWPDFFKQLAPGYWLPATCRRLLPSLAALLALGTCGIVFAQEPAEPQQLAADVQAQPIDPQAQPIQYTAPVTPTNTLRWQAKKLDVAVETTLPATSTATRPLRAGWNITRIDPNVRPAQAIGSDPFTDPFGDKQSAQRGPALTLAPSSGEAAETLPPPRTTSALRRQTQQTPALNAAQPSDGSPGPGAGPTRPGQTATPCDRVYNDHNCCDTEIRCNDFRDRLLADNIRRISLDITPRYNPSADITPEQELQEKNDKLRLLETRTWKDRRGQVAATGKMSDIKNGFLIIVDDAGKQTGRILLHDLGPDELCYVTSWWELPAECGLGGLREVERHWMPSTYAWHASALCHKPLYFEDVQLERYGHTAGPIRQPWLSAAHFCKDLVTLPYHMGINPCNECQYPLGYYRPGSCAPWMIEPIPLSLRGAIAETAVVLGGIYVLP